MKLTANTATATTANKVVPLPVAKVGRKPITGHRERFRIIPFVNATGSQSWRVTGSNRQGKQVRENFADLKSAQCRKLELTADWLGRQGEDSTIRATRLSETQVRLAEAAFMRLDADDEILSAVDNWLKHGKQNSVTVSPRLDEAVIAFKTWLETSNLRDRTRGNLRCRLNVFANSVGNLRICDITPEVMDGYLETRKVSPASKDNDRRSVSRFFSWAMDRKRRWMASNPCHVVKVEQGEQAPPAVLSLGECEKLLRTAERLRKGKLVPYLAVCLFGGLRPTEAQRLDWKGVNLADREIRLEGTQTKTGRGRVLAICDTLAAWLNAYKGQPFFPPNWRKDFRRLKIAAGYGTPNAKQPDLKPWTPDIMRHTAISHYFRRTGSYGQTAEQFGNSEAIIKNHYQGRVTSEDTKQFYALRPARKGAGK